MFTLQEYYYGKARGDLDKAVNILIISLSRSAYWFNQKDYFEELSKLQFEVKKEKYLNGKLCKKIQELVKRIPNWYQKHSLDKEIYIVKLTDIFKVL